jgi:hypothetical protein
MGRGEEHMICACGDPTALGVVHLRTRPCFHYVEREWVGLTNEEIVGFIAFDGAGRFAVIEAIEAKLKEKNT